MYYWVEEFEVNEVVGIDIAAGDDSCKATVITKYSERGPYVVKLITPFSMDGNIYYNAEDVITLSADELIKL